MYFSLRLYDLGNVEIDDKCMIDPRICTYINVKSNSIDQEIEIDEGCKHRNADPGAEKVIKFLGLIWDILDSKQT